MRTNEAATLIQAMVPSYVDGAFRDPYFHLGASYREVCADLPLEERVDVLLELEDRGAFGCAAEQRARYCYMPITSSR